MTQRCKTTYLEIFGGGGEGRSDKFKKLPKTAQIFSPFKMIPVDLSLANRRETTRRGGSEYEVKQKMFEVYTRANAYTK